MELIAEGSTLEELAASENLLDNGDKVEVRIYLPYELFPTQIELIEADVCQHGVYLTEPICQVVKMLVIWFKKGEPVNGKIQGVCLSVIANAVGDQLTVTMGQPPIEGWQLSRETGIEIPWWAIAATVAGGALIGLVVSKRK